MPTIRSRRLRTAAALSATAVLTAVVGYRFGADAGAPPAPSAVVTITPCRLADTRPAPDNVGVRNTPIGTNQSVTFNVWGTNGNCTIPTNATAIIANVTIVSPTAGGFLTIYPADATQPTASNLNWKAGQGATPNLVTVGLSAAGAIKVYNKTGTVHVIIDITAYLQPVIVPVVQGRNRLSLDQIARLRWDQDPGRVASFATSNSPTDVAFDGTNIWVTDSGTNKVSRINPATGDRVDFTTGTNPTGVAFDGTWIWVANGGSDSVSRIDPVSGATTDFPTYGSSPLGITFDGTWIWITHKLDWIVAKMNPADGSIPVHYVIGPFPTGITFDGTNMWVANVGADNLTKIDPDGARTNYAMSTNSDPTYMAFDGTYLWVTENAINKVAKVDPATGALLAEYDTGNGPTDIAYDGTNLWVTNNLADTLSKINPAKGTKTDYPVGADPMGVAYDGTSIWVVNNFAWNVSRLIPGQ